ncbi:MAG: alpha/beta hydrolase [Dehalococcoidales bacterium]|nr:MAG: alpha/beta hydrolase [Dehalococcoidales bacterium]
MPYFNSEGVNIHYEVEGTGPEVVMVHGFESSLEGNWRRPGMTGVLKTENRCVMIDCRGHGESDKPYDPRMYGAKMLDDIANLMDHLGISQANFLGYSMGSSLSLNMVLSQPERVKAVVLGGFALPNSDPEEVERQARRGQRILEALLADSMESIDPRNRLGREFRRVAESSGADLKALAAIRMGQAERKMPTQRMEPDTLAEKVRSISIPLMTVIGSEDLARGDKSALAMLVPDGCHFQIEGKDHLTLVPDPRFHGVTKAFLSYVNNR